MCNICKAIESTLICHRFTFRVHSGGDRALLFCKANEQSFNILVDGSGMIRLWRFVPSEVDSATGFRGIAIRDPMHEDRIMGWEVTDENDTIFFYQQSIGGLDGDDLCSAFDAQLQAFLRMVYSLQ